MTPDNVHPSAFVHPTAVVDAGAVLEAGSKVWHFSHIMPGATVGMKRFEAMIASIERRASALEAKRKATTAKEKAQLDDVLEWLEYDAEDADMEALTERVAMLKADFGVKVEV